MRPSSKYRVAPPEERKWNGRTWASKAEMRYAQELDIFLANGDVRLIVEQPLFRLGCPENTYHADFLVVESNGDVVAIDVKGVETPAFKRTKKLWEAYGRIPLKIVKRKGDRFCVAEVLPARRLMP